MPIKSVRLSVRNHKIGDIVTKKDGSHWYLNISKTGRKSWKRLLGNEMEHQLLLQKYRPDEYFEQNVEDEMMKLTNKIFQLKFDIEELMKSEEGLPTVKTKESEIVQLSDELKEIKEKAKIRASKRKEKAEQDHQMNTLNQKIADFLKLRKITVEEGEEAFMIEVPPEYNFPLKNIIYFRHEKAFNVLDRTSDGKLQMKQKNMAIFIPITDTGDATFLYTFTPTLENNNISQKLWTKMAVVYDWFYPPIVQFLFEKYDAGESPEIYEYLVIQREAEKSSISFNSFFLNYWQHAISFFLLQKHGQANKQDAVENYLFYGEVYRGINTNMYACSYKDDHCDNPNFKILDDNQENGQLAIFKSDEEFYSSIQSYLNSLEKPHWFITVKDVQAIYEQNFTSSFKLSQSAKVELQEVVQDILTGIHNDMIKNKISMEIKPITDALTIIAKHDMEGAASKITDAQFKTEQQRLTNILYKRHFTNEELLNVLDTLFPGSKKFMDDVRFKYMVGNIINVRENMVDVVEMISKVAQFLVQLLLFKLQTLLVDKIYYADVVDAKKVLMKDIFLSKKDVNTFI